jgi:hypothetical protein
MTTYSVFSPHASRPEEEAEFIAWRFSWPAFFVPPLWALYHRHWGLAAVLATLLTAVAGLASYGLVEPPVTTVMSFGVSLACGVFAADLRAALYRAAGWRELGESQGRRLEEAELRFFSSHESMRPQFAAAVALPTAMHDMLGLFHERWPR